MKVTQRAKRRYQQIRQARRQIRYTFKLFRHTRATRRALAAMVQRMVDQSRRYDLHAHKTRWDQYKIMIDGWPDAAQVIVGVNGLSFQVIQPPDLWDYLQWLDCWPQRKHGQWRCYDASCLEPGPYLQLEDLLFNHLAEPFLAYLAKVPEQAKLILSRLEGSHTTWVEVMKSDESMDLPGHSVVCWPLPSGASLL